MDSMLLCFKAMRRGRVAAFSCLRVRVHPVGMALRFSCTLYGLGVGPARETSARLRATSAVNEQRMLIETTRC